MSRPQKGPRLYLRSGRIDRRTKRKLAPIYFIRDGTKQFSTGCGPDRIAEAEKQLANYIAQKTTPVVARALSDPSKVLVDEVIELYARERAPELADPGATAARLGVLLEYWTGASLAEVNRSRCSRYVEWREGCPIRAFKDAATARKVTAAGARRELEDLSAAIGYWHDEHHLTQRPKVILPKKPESRRDALSRSQTAALLAASMGWWRDAHGKWRRHARSVVANRRHLRRFILIGVYTGTRPGVITKLRWTESETSAWVDVDRGWIFRRGKSERDHATKRRPMIRIPRRLLIHLRRWRHADEIENIERRRLGKPEIETVVHHGGRQISGKIRRAYASAVADAGLFEGVTPHWHRHTAATWLMEANVPGHRAAQYLGMTVQTLEKHYGHHRPDYQSDVLSAIDQGGRPSPHQ